MKLLFAIGLVLLGLLAAGYAAGRDFDARLGSITKHSRFSIAGWELRTAARQMGQLAYIRRQEMRTGDGARLVAEYYTTASRIGELQSAILASNSRVSAIALSAIEAELRSLQEKQIALVPSVEQILAQQIKTILAGQGILNPVSDRLELHLPPLNFKLEEVPKLLVVSPRDRIESMREIVLKQSLSAEEKAAVEVRVDRLGVSSLVVDIGGIATYPTLVDSQASLPSAIETATHEWLHQYLAFKPLGFRYLLDITGLSRDYEIAEMNESVADIVSGEITDLMLKEFYPDHQGNSATGTNASGIDFNLEMRETRKAVDAYLAQGEIERAEEFMEQRRQYLASNGYYIRKLNQAYFAFHGTYGDNPAFLSPIGFDLRELRNQSASLKDFLRTIATITSHRELKDKLR